MTRFSWSEQKSRANRRKHGVSFETAARVFRDPFIILLQDRDVDGESRWQAIGKGGSALLLLVAHTYEDEERIRIISARKATPRESAAYLAQFHAGR